MNSPDRLRGDFHNVFDHSKSLSKLSAVCSPRSSSANLSILDLTCPFVRLAPNFVRFVLMQICDIFQMGCFRVVPEFVLLVVLVVHVLSST